MKQIIVYDIPNDSVRTHISHTLEDFGYIRLQYSVFIGERTQNTLEELDLVLKDLIGSEPADVRIYQMCDKCLAKLIVVSRIAEDPETGGVFPFPLE
ncbi:MAG: CRISPR-associated endonuclease Cas2 [Candidatus Thorarchaeota archaeon]